MIWIVALLAIVVILLLLKANKKQEKGPMPKKHGGFGSGPSRSGHK